MSCVILSVLPQMLCTRDRTTNCTDLATCETAQLQLVYSKVGGMSRFSGQQYLDTLRQVVWKLWGLQWVHWIKH